MTIAHNLHHIQSQLRTYEANYARKPNSVQLLAVSKGQSLDKIKAAVEAGQTALGENYLQEALEKMDALKDEALEWHFIGDIQRNKTRKIAEHFAWVHSIDNINIAIRLNDQRPSHLPPLHCCIEVNINNERSKSGIAPSDAFALINACLHLPNLIIRGLMCIPAPQPKLSAQREPFKQLADLLQSLKQQGLTTLDTLSMGMSDDIEAAVAEGATIVRVGRAIFGQRE